jgi:hypothetical protein
MAIEVQHREIELVLLGQWSNGYFTNRTCIGNYLGMEFECLIGEPKLQKTWGKEKKEAKKESSILRSVYHY